MNKELRSRPESTPPSAESHEDSLKSRKDDIIRMAREAGGYRYEVDWCFEMENLERFFQLAYAAGAAAEREACLDLAESYAKNNTDLHDAIRARGQQ